MNQQATLRAGLIAVAALSLPLIFIVWLHWTVAAEWRGSRSLAADGVSAVAEVVATDASTGPRTEGYRVTYRYLVVGPNGTSTSFSGTRAVDRATYDSLEVGGTVEIRYDPADEARSDIARNDRLATMLVVLVVVDISLVGAGVVIARSARAG